MSAETEIGRRLQAIESRIEGACRRTGRRRSEVTLVGASKRQPVESLRAAHDAGLRTFGENRVQEVVVKAAALPEAIDWHLIGPLQSNKVRRAVGLCSTIHSVDRVKIARAIDRVAGELGVVRRGLLEVNLAEEESKHGFAPARLEETVESLAELSSLEIVGVMAIPPFAAEPEESRTWFRRLRRLRDRLSDLEGFPGWKGWLSMGMSGDFEVAIEEGATHIRVGTELFGPRRPPTTPLPVE
jgi:pyridoxal phosphate enzyme (YggS family)